MAAAEVHARVMASETQLVVVDGPDGAADDALALLQRLESIWSRFVAGSDIDRLNRAAGRPVEVDPLTCLLVDTMAQAWTHTGGAYDPTVVVGANTLDSAADADPAGCGRRHPTGGMTGVVVDRNARRVTLPAGVTLDPGGIGKGLAADLAVDLIMARGAAGALCSIGGDLVVRGRAPEINGWTVGIEQPDDPRTLVGQLALNDGAIATSSTRSKRWWSDGEERHHLIDPATGLSSTTDLASVSVVAGCGWQAEAGAKALILAGSGLLLETAARYGHEAIAVTVSGALHTTRGLAALSSTEVPV